MDAHRNGAHLIAIVDDDPSICRALTRALATHGYRVETFLRARDYLRASAHMKPTCVLADLKMPEIDGLEMYRHAQQKGLDIPTVFMTAVRDGPAIVEAMKSGAMDLLIKPFSSPALLAAVESAVERAERARREQRSVADLWALASGLTPREAEVAALVASGLLNKQVAVAIGTGEKTVKVHRARAMRKLQTHSLPDLVRVTDHLVGSDLRVIRLENGIARRPRIVDIMAAALSRASHSPQRK